MSVRYDDEQLIAADGDTLALAALRSGQHPARGGTLCLSGDCGNCVAIVDGVPWVRTCQTPAAGVRHVQRHPAVGAPTTAAAVAKPAVSVRRSAAQVVVVGHGESGRAAAEAARADGHDVSVFDAAAGLEVVGAFAGPGLIVRHRGATIREATIEHVHAHQVIIATGASELQPVCPGDRLRGLYTPRAAAIAQAAGIELGRIVRVGPDVAALHGGDRDGWVGEVELADGSRHACDTAIVDLGSAPRDLLARMAPNAPIHVVGPAAAAHDLPATPLSGTVCPCSGVTVDDLQGVWDKGFREIELVKRASLCGTGTCQGSVCMPHLRAFVADRSGTTPAPFTGRPASRQLTLDEAGAGYHVDVFRRTPLHDEHLALNANLSRFGGWFRPWNYGGGAAGLEAEYWAVRNDVSIGDVSTLGKMMVSGPDVVDALERIYPNNVHDIRPGRARYVINLNERGHILDDGMICREDDTRFLLTWTSGGASVAEMWMRDWVETWGLKVHVLDRTVSHGAINVTGPKAAQLLQRLGVDADDLPKMLQHRHLDVAGIPCHVMRLSFTGEASFELHHQIHHGRELWQALMHHGETLGIRPHGLQALFGLRLEKGHIIVGQDTEMDSSPRRVGMDWAVKLDKPAFIGRDALIRTAALPDPRRLFGFTMDGPAPLEGSVIRQQPDGPIVGHVTSSWDSPLLGHAVLLGWQKFEPHADVVYIDGRQALVAATPFYDPTGARARA
jgi:glycine cleavage system aminomethyltransferase T